MTGELGIVDRRAGLAAPHAGCRVPGRLRILPATRYTTVSTNPAWARTSLQRCPSRAPLALEHLVARGAPSGVRSIVLAPPAGKPLDQTVDHPEARLRADAL